MGNNESDYWHVLRDICFLYHEQGQYQSIMGDLPYAEILNLKYWEYLSANWDTLDDNFRFIREGCAVMILAMAWEAIDGAGSYIYDYLDRVESCLQDAYIDDKDTETLMAVVGDAVRHVREKRCESPELIEKSQWVYDRYVQRYFNALSSS
jgi:hypothetical protein